VNALERLLIERDCEATVLAFFAALDAHADPEVAEQLAENGIWERAGKRLEGRAAVLSALAKRPIERVTCHLVSNLCFDLGDESHAVARFYLLAYEGYAASSADEPGLRLVGIRACTDNLSRHGERWLINLKCSRPHLPLAALTPELFK
jgi:SnoaL-like domain